MVLSFGVVRHIALGMIVHVFLRICPREIFDTRQQRAMTRHPDVLLAAGECRNLLRSSSQPLLVMSLYANFWFLKEAESVERSVDASFLA